MKLSSITNTDKNLQEKMRFFADYFFFSNELLGKLPNLPFENQLSLVDKCIFQIENNFEYCAPYVLNYLENLFKYHNNLFETKSSQFLKVEDHFKKLKISKDKKDFIHRNDLLKDFNLLKLEYDEEVYFEQNRLALLNLIKCPHPISKHKKEIQYRTRLIVSHFRFKGHSKNSLDTYIKRILSNNKYQFPFRPDIFKIKKKDEYHNATKTFLENRDFDNQFEGLKNLFIADKHKSGFFLYVIDNCLIGQEVLKTFKVVFDQVTFISPFHSDLTNLKRNVKKHDKENSEKSYPNFFGKRRILAIINLGYENIETKKNEGIGIVSDELISFNQYFGGNLIVNSLHYLFFESYAGDQWHSSISLSKDTNYRITQFDYDLLQRNPYEILRKNNSPAKEIILHNEKVFIKAFARNEFEFYWIFIESIFTPLKYNTTHIRKEFEKLLMMVLRDLKINLLQKIGWMLEPHSFNHEDQNLSLEEVYFIYEEIFIRSNMDFNFSQYKTKAKNIYLKDLFELHQKFTTLENKSDWRRYFESLLIDLYAYRNALVHSGLTDRFSNIKFSSVLPELMNKARWKIINHCKENENLEYPELIKTLLNKK